MFEVLNGIDSPLHTHIEEALELAEVDAQSYADIQSRWIGTIGWMVDRIRPVVMLLKRDREEFESVADNMDRLTDWLMDNIPMWENSKILAAARRSQDDHEMGLEAWEVLGYKAELPAWNAALEDLEGEYEVVENKEVAEHVSTHLEEARSLLAALARKAALDCGKPEVFAKIEAASQGFKTPNSWSKPWWKVPFEAVFKTLQEKYLEIVDARHLKLIAQVTSIEDLQNVLEEHGAEVDQDPYDIYRRNESQLKEVLDDAHDLYRVWLEHNDIDQISTDYPPLHELGNEAYLVQWTEAELWRRACSAIDDERFTLACSGLTDVKKIWNILGLDKKTLQEIQQKRAEKDREIARQQRIVEIAGESIELGLIDYEKMLSQHTKRLVHPIGPRASEDEFTTLDSVVDPKISSPGRRRTNVKIRIPRLPPKETEVIGIVGEMHAYRF